MKETDNIILIGMPGSGKSTVGVLVAKALGMDFLDVDLVIQQREGQLLQDIVDSRGVDGFLDAEEAAVCSVNCTRTVIAPGGSAVCREKAARHLKQLGTVIYLELPCSALVSRLHNMGSRGIAMEKGQTLQDVYDYRVPIYQACADHTVSADHEKLQDTVAEVLRAVGAPEHVARRWPEL